MEYLLQKLASVQIKKNEVTMSFLALRSNRWPRMTCALLSLTFLANCTKKSASKTSEWSSPAEVNVNVVDRSKAKKPVIIYYANNTAIKTSMGADEQNYFALTRLLMAGINNEFSVRSKEERQNMRVILDGIETDHEIFRQVVDETQANLISGACDAPTAQEKVGYVGFSNSLTLEDGAGLNHSCNNGPTALSKRLSRNDRFPYNTHPLSDEENLIKALELVREVYPPNKHSYLLVLVSHGHPDQAVTMRLGVDVVKMEKEKGSDFVLDTLSKFKTLGSDGLDKDDESASRDEIFFNQPENYERLDLALQQKKTPGPSATLHGISKLRFYEILSDAGREHGMDFPIVVAQACNSKSSLVRDASVRQKIAALLNHESNIGYVFASEKGLKTKSSLNFEKVFADAQKSNLYDSFISYLKTLEGKKENF